MTAITNFKSSLVSSTTDDREEFALSVAVTDMLHSVFSGSQSDPIRAQMGYKQDSGGHNAKFMVSKR